MSKKKKGYMAEFLVAAIPLVGFLLLGIYPFVMSMVMSFMDLHTTSISDMTFVGLDNYRQILNDPSLLAPILSTLFYTLSLPLRVLLTLFLAFQLTKIKRGQKFFCVVSFIPNLVSMVAAALAFKQIFRFDGGVLNDVLQALGFKPFGWLSDSPISYLSCTMFMSTWLGVGGSTLIYRAALNSVDKSYYEAAEIDGASSWTKFWTITLPAISPVVGYAFTTGVIGSLQVMGEMMVLAPEGTALLRWWPDAGYAVGDTISRVIYNMIFVNPRVYGYGVASAAGWILAVVIFITTRIVMKIQDKAVCYDF